MKDILFFHPSNDYTGSTRVLANFIRKYYNDTPVTIVTKKNNGKGFLSELPNVRILNTWQPNFHGKPIKLVSYIGWTAYSSILALIVGCSYRTFYINTTQPYYAAVMGRLMGKKIIYHVHEVFHRDKSSKIILRKVFDKTPAHRIFVSYYTKEQYDENPKCTWEVKYNELSDSFIEGVNFKPLELRSKSNILMIAALTKAKGVFTLMNVAERLPQKHFTLILNAQEKAIKDFFGEGIPSNVELLPAQSDIHPFLEQADLMLNLSIPSLWLETFGMTVLEAMPYGIPAIVPNVGGPSELVDDNYNGFCIDVTNIDAVTNAINTVLDDRNYSRMCENTLKKYKKITNQ